MVFNQVKTAVLLATLSGLFMTLGYFVGGSSGLLLFAGLSLVMNGYAYFYSDKLVLRMYNAQPLDPVKYDWIYSMVKELAKKEDMPMPSLWLVPMPIANAFATGRNKNHAAVAVTSGILEILDESELRGVLSHELSHVINRDILISTIAATLATAIGFIAFAMRNMAIFGGMSKDNKSSMNPIALIVIAIFMPLAASLIQLAISRSREYLADESGADLSQDPLALASALEKLERAAEHDKDTQTNPVNPTTAHMFIVKPFTFGGLASLFSTHPPIEKRIERLRRIFEGMRFKRI